MKIAVASPESEIVRPGARLGWGARIDHNRGLIIAISALLAPSFPSAGGAPCRLHGRTEL